MKYIIEKEAQDIKLESGQYRTQGIRTIIEGKRFKSIVGWSFAKAVESKKYILNKKYSFLNETKRLYKIIENFYNDDKEKQIEKRKIKKKVEDYLKNSKHLFIESQKYSESTSTSIKDISSDKNIIKNNNNLIKKKIKKKKEINTKGYFDIIIPNVELSKFTKILENNFYSLRADKCIVYDEDKIKKLPKYFHLFIEVFFNTFSSSYKYRLKQIQKYIEILNFGNNIIENEKIRDIYKKDFQFRYSLNLNMPNQKVAETSIFMLIFNSFYDEYTYRFLDNRNSLNLNNDSELNSILPKNSKEVLLCGFVYFPNILRCYRENELIKEIDKMGEELKKMDKIKKEINELYLSLKKNSKKNSITDENTNYYLKTYDNYYNYYNGNNDYNYGNNYYYGNNNYYYSENHYYGNNQYYYNNYYY